PFTVTCAPGATLHVPATVNPLYVPDASVPVAHGLALVRPAHSPLARPPTTFGWPPSAGLTCAAGELPWQLRLPAIVLVMISVESVSPPGAASQPVGNVLWHASPSAACTELTLLEMSTLPPTAFRIAPIQPPDQPSSVRLPSIVLSLIGKLKNRDDVPPPFEVTFPCTVTKPR